MGHPIKLVMEHQGRRQDWLAEQLGISNASVTRYLNGTRSWPPELLELAADVLGVPVDLLRSHAVNFPSGNSPKPTRHTRRHPNGSRAA